MLCKKPTDVHYQIAVGSLYIEEMTRPSFIQRIIHWFKDEYKRREYEHTQLLIEQEKAELLIEQEREREQSCEENPKHGTIGHTMKLFKKELTDEKEL